MTGILAGLGWSDRFARQLLPGEAPARVTDVTRSRLDALGADGALRLQAPGGPGAFAVGDWVAHDGTGAARRLEPATEIARLAAGGGARQLIAANVEALGIVTSCNADFNAARLERYLATALGAGCEPLVILTKADEADPAPYLAQARALSPLVTALALDARDGADVARLHPWVAPGLTLALVGSSGVGKTTLRNALTGEDAATAAIREADARGRHTTTGRSLRLALAGGCLIDTPGMRELGLVGADVAAAFADVEALAAACRFRDCAHEGEPGCAVQAAVAAGTLDPGRVARARKLGREEQANSEAVHERHARMRVVAKRVKGGRARAKAKRDGP